MAQLKDVPHVLRTIGIFTFAKRVWQQLGEDAVFTWGSALAYSWLFAIFPFLIFMLSLVPLIPQRVKPHIRSQMHELIDKSVPSPAAAEIIRNQADTILKLERHNTRGFLSIGLLLTIWGASGGMSMTMSALDKAYDIEKGRSFIRHRLVAIMLTVIVSVMVIAVMVLLPIGSAVMSWFARHAADVQTRLHIPFTGWVMAMVDIARYAISLLLLLAITATIYHFGPNLKQKFHAVTPGAIFSIIVWLVLGALFRVYITRFGEASYSKTYGTVAGLVILLLFFYIDALVLLVGAEINSEIDFAVAGVPSGTTMEQREVAPISSPANKALAEELQQNRPDKALAAKPIDVTESA